MSASSQSTILKNIYSFLDVLQLSHTDVVSLWDQPALDNALRWARYAEQIYNQSQGKPYLSELEAQLSKLARLPWSLGCRNIDMQLLASATQELSLFKHRALDCYYKLKCRQPPKSGGRLQKRVSKHYPLEQFISGVLLQNPSMPPMLLESLLRTTWDLDSGGDRLIKAWYALCHVKSEAHICHAVHGHQSKQPRIATSSGLTLEVLQAYARLILDHFTKVLESAGLERKERTEALLKKKVHKIYDAKCGNEIVLCSLVINYEDPSINQPTQAQKLIFQVVDEIITKADTESGLLWSASPRLLCQVAAAYPNFYTSYVAYLCHEGDVMTPEYPPLEEHQRHLGPVVLWKPLLSERTTYDHLLHHFRDLLLHGRHLVEPTQVKLRAMAAEAECCVWRYLQRDLKKTAKG